MYSLMSSEMSSVQLVCFIVLLTLFELCKYVGQNYGSSRNNTDCQKATIAFRHTTKANDFVLICVLVVKEDNLFYYTRDDPKVLILP